MHIRKKLSASGLFKLIHAGLEKIKDVRADNQTVSLADAAMSAFAIFSLKDASLLAFDEHRSSNGNLKRLYGSRRFLVTHRCGRFSMKLTRKKFGHATRMFFENSSEARLWRSWCSWKAATCSA